MAVTIAILAGGQSRRMGTDKSFVPLNGLPLIEHVMARVKTLALPLLLITNQPSRYEYLNVPLYPDVISDKGAMGGIFSALTHSQTAYTLCIACDMPFLNTGLLAYLIQHAADAEAIVPYCQGQAQGLHAIYHQRCREPMQVCIAQDQLKISTFLQQRQVRWIGEDEIRAYDPDFQSFLNLNTPDDLLSAQLN